MALACSALVSGAKIILVLLPILLMLGVLLYFRAHSSRDLPVRGAILLILLELAYITWIAYRMDRSGYPMGRSLFCKGRYRRSVPHLVKGWRGDVADAARMLGDMLALGLDTEQNREWAVEYYRQAMEKLDTDADLLELFGPQSAPGGFLATTKRDMPADIPAWYRGMVENLERCHSGSPEENSLLSALYKRLGNVDMALSHARRVPDAKERPSQRDSLLAILPEPHEVVEDFCGAEDPGSEPGLPPGRVYIDRMTVEKVTIIPMAVIGCLVLFTWSLSHLDPAVRRLLASLSMLILFAIGWLVFSLINRQDRFMFGERHFLAGRYRPAARIFSYLCREWEPRSMKRLGDMHLYGLAVDENPDKALESYTRAIAAMTVREAMTEHDASGKPRVVAGIVEGEDLNAWFSSIKQPLNVLAEKGYASASSLLADINKRLGNKEEEIGCARAAYRSQPEPLQEVRLAYALIDEGSGPDHVWEGLEILEDLRREGSPSAISALVSYHCGKLVANHKSEGQAVRCYRELWKAALKKGSEEKRARELVIFDSTLLLETFGPDVLTDEDIRMAVALGRQNGTA